ncbi:MAG: hypothetical protein ACOYU2_06075 [Nitrospirota bacterium]
MKKLLFLSVILTLLSSGCATTGGVTSDGVFNYSKSENIDREGKTLIFNNIITVQEDRHGDIYEYVDGKPKHTYGFLSTKRYITSIFVKDDFFVHVLSPYHGDPKVRGKNSGLTEVKIVDPQTNIMISFTLPAERECREGSCWIEYIAYNELWVRFNIITDEAVRKTVKFVVENAEDLSKFGRGEKDEGFKKKIIDNFKSHGSVYGFFLDKVFRGSIFNEGLTTITDPSFFSVISKYAPEIKIQKDDHGNVSVIVVKDLNTLYEIAKLLRKPEVQKAIKEGI